MTRVLIASVLLACFAATASADETYQQRLARWQAQYRAEHPGQPMPNDGVLQKLHRDELIKQTNADWDAGRKERQDELKREYLLSRYNQQQINTKNGVKWTDAQWRAWDQRYSDEHQKQAEDFAKSWALMGEMARQQAMQEEHDRYVREHP
jgi:hypothetical protein